MIALLGKKIGMTRVFNEKGNNTPVTVIECGPCYVLKVINETESNYQALQLGFDELKSKRINKADLKRFEKVNVKPQRYVREVRLTKEEVADFKVGQILDVSLFKEGDIINVTGTSIGKGFQGGMKRWGWHGGPQTHGSMSHRRPGSIGSSTDPSRVFRGHHLPGRMGNKTATVKHLKVVSVDKERNALLLKGAVPGYSNNYIIIKKAKKQPLADKKK